MCVFYSLFFCILKKFAILHFVGVYDETEDWLNAQMFFGRICLYCTSNCGYRDKGSATSASSLLLSKRRPFWSLQGTRLAGIAQAKRRRKFRE